MGFSSNDRARTLAGVTEARLLLVDDDTAHLDALAERLSGDGFEVARAASGAEALEHLDAAWPDLVILDLMMPEMDGQTLAARIKTRADIPILVLSATADMKSALGDAPVQGKLAKPFAIGKLLNTVQQMLEGVQARAVA